MGNISDYMKDPFLEEREPYSKPQEKECELFGDFGIIVQVVLGVLSFSGLFAKRHFEYPKRSF